MPTASASLFRLFLTGEHARLCEEQARLCEEVETFAEANLAPLTAGMEARGPHTDHKVRTVLSTTGWLGVLIGAKWGGLDLGHVAKTLILAGLSRRSPAAGAILQASILGAAPIAEYGSEEMRRTWLPEIAAGRCWPTIAVTDPQQGSHILGMTATTRRSGQGYVLDGEKVFVGNAGIADVHCVIARTGSPGDERSLTAFLVERDSAGLDIVRRPANGLFGFSIDTLRLTGVHVPTSHIIGRVGDGLAVAQLASVVYGRLNLAAVALGIHQRLLDETARWVSARPRYDGHLSDLETVRHHIAEMKHHLMATELAVYGAAQLLDQGQSCDPWLYHAKLTAHRAGAAASEHAKQLFGGYAACLDTPIEQLRRDFDLIHAPAGPDDLQLKRLAETVLGPDRSRRARPGHSRQHRSEWSTQHALHRRTT
ncbi:acyl-CoA dehydrogenase family protein [Streptomyces olivaceoviridis]|uniref:acyl-CoA dehydrogenase family protein n=1 Tax=Streptomyces olivaceoviridis TaxID=1921 RepID=UPI0033180F15